MILREIGVCALGAVEARFCGRGSCFRGGGVGVWVGHFGCAAGVGCEGCGYCFRDSKRAEKIWQRSRKDAAKMPIFYIQVFGHRPPRKAPHRRLNACGRGRRWGKATGRITRTAPKPANSLLSRRQEQKRSGRASQKSRMQ